MSMSELVEGDVLRHTLSKHEITILGIDGDRLTVKCNMCDSTIESFSALDRQGYDIAPRPQINQTEETTLCGLEPGMVITFPGFPDRTVLAVEGNVVFLKVNDGGEAFTTRARRLADWTVKPKVISTAVLFKEYGILTTNPVSAHCPVGLLTLFNDSTVTFKQDEE